LLLLGTRGIEVPVGSPDFTIREQVWVTVSSEVVTTQTATVRTPVRVAALTNKEKHN